MLNFIGRSLDYFASDYVVSPKEDKGRKAEMKKSVKKDAGKKTEMKKTGKKTEMKKKVENKKIDQKKSGQNRGRKGNGKSAGKMAASAGRDKNYIKFRKGTSGF